MPDIYLPSGGMITVDDVDFEWVSSLRWRLWTRRNRHQLEVYPVAIHDEYRGARCFRMSLHREIAARMRPEIITVKTRVVVKAINRNFLDVRRENLEITICPATKGRPRKEPRPTGWSVKGRGGKQYARGTRKLEPSNSQLWTGGVVYKRDYSSPNNSRALVPHVGGKRRGEAVGGDGSLRDPADELAGGRCDDPGNEPAIRPEVPDGSLSKGSGLARQTEEA